MINALRQYSEAQHVRHLEQKIAQLHYELALAHADTLKRTRKSTCEGLCLAKRTLLSRIATLTYFFMATKEKQLRAEQHIRDLKAELSEAYGVIVFLSIKHSYTLPSEEARRNRFRAVGPVIPAGTTIYPDSTLVADAVPFSIFPDVYPTN